MKRYTVICVGSNIDRKCEIVAGIIGELGGILNDFENSDLYVSDDDSGLGLPYANAVCCGYFDGTLPELTRLAARREKDFGRTARSKPSGVMPLDIDIVVFGDKILNDTQFNKSYFLKGYKQLSDKSHAAVCTSDNSKTS